MNLYPYRSAEGFESDLEELLRWFEPVALGDYLAIENPDKRRNVMVITFDDGLSGCYEVIVPLLRRKGIPAVFFLNNNFIDNRELFFRYKASILVHRINSGTVSRKRAADFLSIPEKKVTYAILKISHHQRSVLDELAELLGVDFQGYLRERPVYLTSPQVIEMIKWGFEIGGHSPDHADFTELDPEEMISQVSWSIEDLRQRFAVTTGYFSFPFTSFGVPDHVIETLLNGQVAEALMGTSGMKQTGRFRFIQRIPMEEFNESALNAIKAEYLYYLIKAPLGRNRY